MKSVLLIDVSTLLDGFFHDKLSTEQISLESISTGAAYAKMLTLLPDLMVIETEKDLSDDARGLLEKKMTDPNAKTIPVIIIGPPAERSKIMNLLEFNVVKYFPKPIDFETFFPFLEKTLGLSFAPPDMTPCILDLHLNENLIFVEISLGLNRDKILLLKYRIAEMIQKYKITIPKVILMMTNLQLSFVDGSNLELLLDNISAKGRIANKNIRILTFDTFVADLVKGHPEYTGIKVAQDLTSIADFIVNVDKEAKDSGEKVDMQEMICNKILGSNKPDTVDESNMEFDDSRKSVKSDSGSMMRIAVVDDDVVIRKLLENTFTSASGETDLFENAASFFAAIGKGKEYDAVVLDLYLPDMDGLGILKNLQRKGFQSPIVIYSKAVAKDVVVQALALGAKSYLVKPQKPAVVLNKVIDVLHSES